MQFGAFSSDDTKIAVRRALRVRLRALGACDRDQASARIAARLIEFEPHPAGRFIASFFALPTEPDLAAFHGHAWKAGAQLAVPRLTGPGSMVFHRVPADTLPPPLDAPAGTRPAPALRPGPHGLWEPDPVACPLVQPAEIDLALVPGLGFAPGGMRLGRGAGYYDRWLAALPARTLRIGIAFACQILPDLPAAPHDRPVHAIVTEDGWTPGCQDATDPASPIL